jgi:hypothetical protein
MRQRGTQAVALGEAIRKREEDAAKERQRQGGKKAGRGRPAAATNGKDDSKGLGNLPGPIEDRARDRIADALGMSGRTYEKAKAVVDAAEAEPATDVETVGSLQLLLTAKCSPV